MSDCRHDIVKNPFVVFRALEVFGLVLSIYLMVRKMGKFKKLEGGI